MVRKRDMPVLGMQRVVNGTEVLMCIWMRAVLVDDDLDFIAFWPDVGAKPQSMSHVLVRALLYQESCPSKHEIVN